MLKNLERTKIGRVRNQLIQHPEKQKNKQKLHPSFSAHIQNGPQLKDYIESDGSYNDEGLFANAEDFIQKFIKILEGDLMTAS